MNEDAHRCSILVADDDEGDRFLIDKALKIGGVDASIRYLEDGQQLVDHLREDFKADNWGAQPKLPCLIFLDLNMPRMDGREALKIVKRDSKLREIPVIILSNSDNPDDIRGSYLEGANSFFTKPLDFREFVNLMALLKTYWLQKAKLPVKMDLR